MQRKDFENTEPLSLYSHAQTLSVDQKFLFLYRILEFFIYREEIIELREMRYDRNISEVDIMKRFELRKRNEREQFQYFLNKAISCAVKDKLKKYALHHELIKEKEDFSIMIKNLGGFS